MNEHFFPTVTVMLDKFANDLEVEMLYAGRGIVKLTSISVDRPGLRLAGFFSYFDTQRILIIGLTEHEYLRSFSSEERKAKIQRLFDCGEIPAARSPASSSRAIFPSFPNLWSVRVRRVRPSSALRA